MVTNRIVQAEVIVYHNTLWSWKFSSQRVTAVFMHCNIYHGDLGDYIENMPCPTIFYNQSINPEELTETKVLVFSIHVYKVLQ